MMLATASSSLALRVGARNRSRVVFSAVRNLCKVQSIITTQPRQSPVQKAIKVHYRRFAAAEPSSSLSHRFQSTAALQEEEDDDFKPERRRKLEKKNPIIVTERAADRIKEILNGGNAAGALGIRLGVKRRGCNGLSYTLNYAFEKPEKDLEMESHGVTVFIEPMALFSVVGTVMDWEETELSSEFTFNNPNSKGECGCGESFTV